MKALSRICLLVAAAAMGAHATAQLNLPTMLENAVVLLGSQPVRTELKLSEKQDKDVANAFKRYVDKANGLMAEFRKDPSKRTQLNGKLRTYQQELITACRGIMSQQQETRLIQLGIQSLGPFAIGAKDVSSALKLTEAQKAKVKKAVQEFDAFATSVDAERKRKFDAIPKPKDPKDKKQVEAYQKRLQEVLGKSQQTDLNRIRQAKKSAENKVLAALTPAQKQQFTAMQGKPFNFGRK
jgi:hypothetical protein